MTELHTGDFLWKATETTMKSSGLYKFRKWLSDELEMPLDEYSILYRWSINHPGLFWEFLLKYFKILYDGSYQIPCSEDLMPDVKWFDGISLNYAEHIFRNRNDQFPAFIALRENGIPQEISWSELEQQVSSIQYLFGELGLHPGDRIAAYSSNLPETSASLLATLSSGLVWSSCSPDFGVDSAVDRFKQIEPAVLIAVTGYSYGGRVYDRRVEVAALVRQIPSIKAIIWIDSHELGVSESLSVPSYIWKDLIRTGLPYPKFVRVPFGHPIWVLYSSGTTGLPKPIVHGHGGMLLEHLKYLVLHNDVRVGERFFWYSTTGWMMWNFVHGSLLAGATAVLYDGSPAFPDLSFLWKIAETFGIHHFGTSAPFLVACMKQGLSVKSQFSLPKLRSIGSTGSPLPPEAFEYVYREIKPEVWLCSMSGGTDVCTAFVGSCIERAVHVSEIQCRALGVALEAWDDNGHAIENEMGEMVIVKPMPCMPVFFWNDPDKLKYRASYFEEYPGIWRHGDWIEITSHDGLIIYGRSDATLNRHGVRIGTAEIYNVLNSIAEIKDALIINLELDKGEHYMPLFVQLQDNFHLNEDLKLKIKSKLRQQCSPRHVPDAILAVPDIPYTISGKKMESPVKKIMMNMDLNRAYNPGAMRNPDSMLFFIDHRKELLSAQDVPIH